MLASADSAATTICHAAPASQYISLLSSSPPRINDAETLGARNSPLPIERKRKISTLKTGSRAAPIPDGAVTGFQKASLLARDSDSNSTVELFSKQRAEGETLKPDLHDSESHNRVCVSIFTSELGHRSSKEMNLPQSNKQRSKPETTCSGQKTLVSAAIAKPFISSLQALNDSLVDVVRIPSDAPNPASTAAGFVGVCQQSENDKKKTPKVVESVTDQQPPKLGRKSSPNKRPKLLHTSPKARKSNPSISPGKTKVSAKRPLTITGRAIANVQAKNTREFEELDENVPPMSVCNTAGVASGCKQSDNLSSTKRKNAVLAESAEESKKLSRATKTKVSNPSTKIRPLRSPTSAIRRMTNQQFVFGTSSQIERDEEANYDYQMQIALKLSAAAASSCYPLAVEPSPSTKLNNATRNLWSAGSRGPDGDTFFSPDAVSKQSNARDVLPNIVPDEFGSITIASETEANLPKHNDLTEQHERASGSKGVLHKAKSITSRIRLTSDQLPKRKMTLQTIKLPQSSMPGASVISKILSSHSGTQTRCIHTNGKNSALSGHITNPKDTTALEQNEKPHIAGETSSDQPPPPSKKARGRPRKAISKAPPKELPVVDTIGPSSKQKGTATTTKIPATFEIDTPVAIEDIEDNEPPSPSPPRYMSSQPPIQLQMSRAETQTNIETEEINAGGGSLCAGLDDEAKAFSLISQMVKSQSSSRDPHSTNWHEKILLYDPITLEDFTVWLNENINGEDNMTSNSRQQKNTAKANARLKPDLVQKWCQKNGVCCLCKSGMRSGFRQRF